MSFWKTASLEHVRQYDTDAYALPLGSAIALVHRSGILTAKGPLNVLDNACGTGTVSQYLMDSLPADRRDDICLTLADISPNMVDAARAKAEDKGWKISSVQTVDMQDMRVFPDDAFDYILINQGIQFAPDADATVKELFRILKKGGGTLAITTWRSTDWTETIRQAVGSIEGCPAFPAEDELLLKVQHGNAWHDETFLQEQLKKHGFADVASEVSVREHPLARDTFVNTFTGPMLRGILQALWTEIDVEHNFPKIRPATANLLEQGAAGGVVVTMTAIVAVGRKA